MLGKWVNQKAPEMYAQFKYFLNNSFYKAVLPNAALMPLNERGNILIGRSKDPHLFPPPAFITASDREALDSRIEFFNRLVQKYPSLNVYIYNITTLDSSNLYEELMPLARYQRDISAAFKMFQRSLPAAIVYSQFDYDLMNFREYFYKTDHHWTIKGAFRAYVQVLDMIKTKVPDIGVPVYPRKYFKVDDIVFRGSFANKSAYETQTDELWDFDKELPRSSVHTLSVIIWPT